ncbi:MAG: molybdopterin cofactor-binding domain-containing protein [Acetobacteraceae bacterium]
MSLVSLPRRRLLQVLLTASGGLAVGVGPTANAAPAPATEEAPSEAPSETWAERAPGIALGPWLIIQPDESVLVRVPKSEMGQGVLTALAMIVAEELGAEWAAIRVEYASANANCREAGVYGRMGTGGSSSIRTLHFALQQIGASARVRLIAAAAETWRVSAARLRVENGAVIEPASGRSIRFGALAAHAALVRLAHEPRIKRPAEYRLIGRPIARLDTPVKVTGAARFGIDTRLPDMLYAALVRPPVLGAQALRWDQAAVLSRRGIAAVVPVPGGLAVVADNFWRAKEAAEMLPVTWSEGAKELDTAALGSRYEAALAGPTATALSRGDAASALASQPQRLEALYEVPYLAHATMEPLNCTAHVQPDRLDAWLGTQNPDRALAMAARASGLPPQQIHIHNCYLGGGFGRRGTNDELAQAIAASRAVGRPVKLVWTREDDIRADRFRPRAAIRMRAGLDPSGVPQALEMLTAVDSIEASLFGYHPPAGYEAQAVEGLTDIAYAVPHLRVGCALQETAAPVMFWRSVGYSQNAFAVECFIDEMASALGQDPLFFRRRLLTHRADYQHLLDVLAEAGDWGEPLSPGRGRGLAISESHDTIVGQIAEVAVGDAGEIRVERIVVAVDCGHVVNPQILATQMESAVVYGLTAALYGEITIEKGRVVEGNFDRYRMLRMAECPRIETHLALSGGSKWGGIGEPGVPPVAPAVCNAIFAATGRRIRRLPLLNGSRLRSGCA